MQYACKVRKIFDKFKSDLKTPQTCSLTFYSKGTFSTLNYELGQLMDTYSLKAFIIYSKDRLKSLSRSMDTLVTDINSDMLHLENISSSKA